MFHLNEEYDSNFINPYTGSAYHDYSPLLKSPILKEMFKNLDNTFLAMHKFPNDIFKSSTACVYIRPQKSDKIGIIYTTAPSSVVERIINME